MGSFAKVGWKLWYLGNGPWGSGNGLWLTAIDHAKVTAVCLRTYYKHTGGRLKLFNL